MRGALDDRAEVVIVGGGVIGLSVARALVERGVHDVLVLERRTIGAGGTGKSSGIVRCHYGVRSLAAMAWHSLPVLEDAAELLGAESGFRRTGYLVGVGHDDLVALRANVAMQRDVGIEVELVGSETARQMWPAAGLDDFAEFAYEPRGGYGDGHLTALAFATAARHGGARLRQGCPVTALATEADRAVGVRLADGSMIGTDAVVLAAGPWSVPLAAAIGIEVPIRSQRAQVLVVATGRPLGPAPVFSDLVALQYVRRDGPSEILVGSSDHSDPEWSDPDDYRERAGGEELLDAVSKFIRRFPGLDDASLSSSYAGCYDVTPDYNPVISPLPVAGLWLCAGFSGHGYKISPAVGELAADLVLEGTSNNADVDHRDFRFGRFADEELLVSPHPYAGAGQMR